MKRFETILFVFNLRIACFYLVFQILIFNNLIFFHDMKKRLNESSIIISYVYLDHIQTNLCGFFSIQFTQNFFIFSILVQSFEKNSKKCLLYSDATSILM